MNCTEFRDQIYHYQADELAGEARVRFEAHGEACAVCAGRLRVEHAFLEGLRGKLTRTPAPPGLETRIRSGLAGATAAAAAAWYRSPWAAALAAALLMALLIAPGVTGGPSFLPAAPGEHERVVEVVTVVDHDCAEAGLSIEQQRRCRHPLHVNALRREDGEIWNLNSRQVAYRRLLLDPEQRGRRFRLSGELFHALETIRIDRLEPMPENRL